MNDRDRRSVVRKRNSRVRGNQDFGTDTTYNDRWHRGPGFGDLVEGCQTEILMSELPFAATTPVSVARVG
ncbi:MAG: hypothetical protein E5W49_28085, partial [Mesorhizobium sp.]